MAAKTWTKMTGEEIALAKKMYVEGCECSDIAETLGRNQATISRDVTQRRPRTHTHTRAHTHMPEVKGPKKEALYTLWCRQTCEMRCALGSRV